MTVATYPAYNAANNASAWFYGLASGLASGGVYKSFGGTTVGIWGFATMPLILQPGTYYLTESGVMGGYTTATDLSAARLAIFEDSAGALTPITLGNGLTYVDMTADISQLDGSNGDIGPTTIPSVSFTIEAGKSYQLAWGLQKAGTNSIRPGVMYMADGQGPQGLTSYHNSGGASFPVAVTGTANSTGEVVRGYIKFTTAVRKLVSTTYSAAKDLIIPRRISGDYCIHFQSAVVADGQSLTAALCQDNAGSDAVLQTAVLDMGATDQVTFGGANVALAAAGAEAGDTFHLMIQHRSDNKEDLFYQNRTTGQGPANAATDFATFSHATKNNAAGDGSRGQEYTVTAAPQYTHLTGTAAVAAIEVGWEPLVILGDSQCALASDRFCKHLPGSFTYPRIYWDASISGNRVTEDTAFHTAGYKRYKSPTAGQGDVCEMQSVVLVVAGFGVNDIASNIGATEANRDSAIADIGYRILEILSDAKAKGNAALIIGLPPYSISGDASVEEAAAIKYQLNPLLEGIAVGCRCAYVNPWWAMVQGGTSEIFVDGGGGADTVPVFTEAYTSDSGLHYSSAGNLIVSQYAARAFETGILGGWWSRRRRSRQSGSLFPI